MTDEGHSRQYQMERNHYAAILSTRRDDQCSISSGHTDQVNNSEADSLVISLAHIN